MEIQKTLRDGLLTVVLPAYNEQDSVPLAADTICPLLEGEGIRHEILFVNDGSRDGTWKAIQAQAARHPEVRGALLPQLRQGGCHFCRPGPGQGGLRGSAGLRPAAPAGEDCGDVPPLAAGLSGSGGS